MCVITGSRHRWVWASFWLDAALLPVKESGVDANKITKPAGISLSSTTFSIRRGFRNRIPNSSAVSVEKLLRTTCSWVAVLHNARSCSCFAGAVYTIQKQDNRTGSRIWLRRRECKEANDFGSRLRVGRRRGSWTWRQRIGGGRWSHSNCMTQHSLQASRHSWTDQLLFQVCYSWCQY